MNLVRAVFVGFAAAAGSGCFSARPSASDNFLHLAGRNLTEKPIALHDEKAFLKFVRQRADEAWATICRESGNAFSSHYAEGFREGFIDYVEAGGSGEPPYLPPFRYRLAKFRSPEGIAATEDWYAGFRHGAAVARGSGLRELSYVPLPGSPVPVETHAPEPLTPNPPAPGTPQPKPDVLPPPRPVGPQMPPPVPPVPGGAGAKAPVGLSTRGAGAVLAVPSVPGGRERVGDDPKPVVPATRSTAPPRETGSESGPWLPPIVPDP
jgi:hypothetical protein